MKTWKSFLQINVRKRMENKKLLPTDLPQILTTYALYYKCNTNEVDLGKILA